MLIGATPHGLVLGTKLGTGDLSTKTPTGGAETTRVSKPFEHSPLATRVSECGTGPRSREQPGEGANYLT
jgi:hypothetical protein